MKNIGSNDKSLKTVENGMIELYCDTGKDALGLTILEWILKRAPNAQIKGNMDHFKLKSGPKKSRILNLKNLFFLVLYISIIK